MALSKIQQSKTAQYLISLGFIAVTIFSCYFFIGVIDYRVVALILLLVVSILAMLFDIFPVLLAAMISAVIWNFFFIPPTMTFRIRTPEDGLMFLMYFVIAMINIVLTSRIKSFEKKIRDRGEREKTIKLYNTLLNSLSHELRTPISTVIGAIDTIKENQNNLSDNDKQELFNEIEIAGIRLNRQVENLLNMSRLEAEALKPKSDWCDVNELVHTIIKNNREHAEEHHIIFETDEQLPLFKLDRGLTEQILNNILHNALQYTHKGSTIEIKAFQKGSNCCFVVTDNGKGVTEKEIDYVFDKFYRSAKASTGGTGLGLSIAKGFTEAQNGTIHLENIKTGGARFTIEIPASVSSINKE